MTVEYSPDLTQRQVGSVTDMTALDVAAARAVTPGCGSVLHLNHAGASLTPQPVLDAVIAHLQLEATTGGYEAAAAAADRLAHTYDALAALLGCASDEIALTDSATRSWQSAVNALPLSAGQQVITTRAEYGSNGIALVQLKARTGCEIVLVDDDVDGQVDLDGLARALEDDRVAMVSLTHVPTQGGLVNPAAEVGRLCRAADVLFVLDACQSAGQLPLDVRELGCQILTGTGRKFLRGPRGTGFLYIERELAQQLDPPMIDTGPALWVSPDRYELRPDTRRFEMFESFVAGRVGLGVAVDHALGWGIEAIAARNAELASGLRERLREIPGVRVHDRGKQLCAITTFTVDGVAADEVADRLRAQGTNVSVSRAGSAQFDLPRRGLQELVRASVHYVTTDEELDTAAAQVAAIAR
jgi:selenocysteine lyase/cysteine desulfurase